MKELRIQNFETIQNNLDIKNIFEKKLKNTKNYTITNVSEILKNNIQGKEIFGTNLNLFTEKLLANIFWLDDKKIKKLSLDYEENLTLSQTLDHAENFWGYRKINV